MRRLIIASILSGTGSLFAQNFEELTLVRNKPVPYQSVLQVQGGLLYGKADDEDEAIGLESKAGIDGHVYLHSEKTGGKTTTLDAYAGRDGFYFGAKDGSLAGQGTQTRLELTGRMWPFYREGFYRGKDFVPTGRYEGRDLGGMLAAGRALSEGVQLDFGAFYKRYLFDRNGDTAANYTVPQDYNAYGAQIWFEQTTLNFDQRTKRAISGFQVTIQATREFNDSDGTMGTAGVWTSTLPDAFWRGRGAIDWYFPGGDSGAFELYVKASISDEGDRIYNYDAQKTIGHLTVDADLGYRWDLGDEFFIQPIAKGQYVTAVDEQGTNSSSEFFYGLGVKMELSFSEGFALLLDYSYLNNESRPPVSVSEDTFGEHQLFTGVRLRF